MDRKFRIVVKQVPSETNKRYYVEWSFSDEDRWWEDHLSGLIGNNLGWFDSIQECKEYIDKRIVEDEMKNKNKPIVIETIIIPNKNDES